MIAVQIFAADNKILRHDYHLMFIGLKLLILGLRRVQNELKQHCIATAVLCYERSRGRIIVQLLIHFCPQQIHTITDAQDYCNIQCLRNTGCGQPLQLFLVLSADPTLSQAEMVW